MHGAGAAKAKLVATIREAGLSQTQFKIVVRDNQYFRAEYSNESNSVVVTSNSLRICPKGEEKTLAGLFRKSGDLWEELDTDYKPLSEAKALPELIKEIFPRYGITT